MVGGAVVAPRVAAAASHPNLPAITPQALLEKVEAARVDNLTGTVELKTHLGLPDLGLLDNGGGSSPTLTNLLSGNHQAKVWYAGPDNVRVALPGWFSETDVFANGTDVWVWQSGPQKATHVVLPADGASGSSAHRHPRTPPTGPVPTPASVTQTLLDKLDPTTQVLVSNTATVAGRSAYELELVPRSTRTLVGRVAVAVDSETGLPLRVQVLPRGTTTPAIELGFSSIGFDRPAAANFSFHPPAHATVTRATSLDQVLQETSRSPRDQRRVAFRSSRVERGQKVLRAPVGVKPPVATSTGGAIREADTTDTKVIGQGWDAVVVTHVDPTRLGDGVVPELLRSGRRVSGAWGSGRLLTTALVDALVLDDGTIVAGSVSPAVLEGVAAGR